jgi:hypothetical protein
MSKLTNIDIQVKFPFRTTCVELTFAGGVSFDDGTRMRELQDKTIQEYIPIRDLEQFIDTLKDCGYTPRFFGRMNSSDWVGKLDIGNIHKLFTTINPYLDNDISIRI